MTPMWAPGPTELIIILVIVVLLFGGSRLAGLGKSTGRALKEFKEETKGFGGAKGEEGKGEGEDPTADPRATAELDAKRDSAPAEPTNSELRKDA